MKFFWMPALVIATALVTTGCMSHNVSQPTAPLVGHVDAALTADLAVGEKISGQSSTNLLFGFLQMGGDSQFADGVAYGGSGGSAFSLLDPVASTKAAAAYKAVKSSGSDLIVAPRYEVNVKDYFFFKQVDVKVTGNKGIIERIRPSSVVDVSVRDGW
jgi:hypothetical protein